MATSHSWLHGISSSLPPFIVGARVDGLAVAAAVTAGCVSALAVKCALIVNRPPAGTFVPSVTNRGVVLNYILGHLPEMFLGVGEAGARQVVHCQDAIAAGASVLCLYGLGQQFLAPLDPRDIEYMMLQNGLNYVKPSLYEAGKFFAGEHGLVVMRDETSHALHRRLLSPAFSPNALRAMYDGTIQPRVDHSMKDVAELTKDGKPVVLEHSFDEFALGVICEAAFRETSFEGVSIGKSFQTILDCIQAAPYMFLPGGHLVRTEPIRRCLRSRDDIKRAATAMLQRARQHIVTDEKNKLLVDYMADAKELSDDVVSDHSITFLLAGHETTSTTLMWAAYVLSIRPDVQQTLFDEVEGAFGLTQVPSLDTARGLSYLSNVAREVLRTYPPLTGLQRSAVEDDVLPYSGVVIPAGSNVWFNIFGLHHDPRLWGADALEFKPERWDDPTLADRLGQAGWMPFFIGKRNCIGKEFAFNELLASLGALVRRFKLEFPEDATRPLRQEKLTMRSNIPIPLRLVKRTA